MVADRLTRIRRSIGTGGDWLDLVVTVATTVLIVAFTLVSGTGEMGFRTATALAFAFFFPGYAVISSLFPARTTADATVAGREVDGFARVVLSIGTSVVMVSLIGVVLASTSMSVEPLPFVLVTGSITVLAAITAVRRRRLLPEEERFRVPVDDWFASGRAGVFETERPDAILNVVLAAAILFGTASVGYAVVTPQHGEEYSTITILTDEDGELVTDGYSANLEPGQNEPFVVAIDNHEHEPASYTLVLVEQQVESAGGTGIVTDQRELDRVEEEVEHGETWHHAHELEPTTSEETRIAWLLYVDDDAPSEPSIDTADHYVHLWANDTGVDAESVGV